MKKDSKHRKSRLIDRHRNHDHLKLCDWDIKSMGCSVLQHNAVCCSAKISGSHAEGDLHVKASNGVATIGRLLKIIGLFCKRAL